MTPKQAAATAISNVLQNERVATEAGDEESLFEQDAVIGNLTAKQQEKARDAYLQWIDRISKTPNRYLERLAARQAGKTGGKKAGEKKKKASKKSTKKSAAKKGKKKSKKDK